MSEAHLSSQQVQEIYHAIILAADGVVPSTYKEELKAKPQTMKKTPLRPNAKHYDVVDARYWLSGPRKEAVTSRAAAFLRAYLALGGDFIPSRGIASIEGEYLWLNQGVMKTLLKNEMVELDNGHFVLTDIGRTQIFGKAQSNE